MTRAWPFPGDRPVDRARQVASQYRAALHAVDADACAAIDRAAQSVGEDWVIPQVAQFGPDDWVTVTEAAALTGRSTRWVYAWIAGNREHRCVHGADGLSRVRVQDVQEAAARGRHPLR